MHTSTEGLLETTLSIKGFIAQLCHIGRPRSFATFNLPDVAEVIVDLACKRSKRYATFLTQLAQRLTKFRGRGSSWWCAAAYVGSLLTPSDYPSLAGVLVSE